MTTWGGRGAHLLAVVLIGTLLPLTVTGPAWASAGYQQPRSGQCRSLTYAQLSASSNSTRPISCSRSHTTQTLAVKRLPRTLTWSSSPAKLTRAIGRACTKAYAGKVGQSTSARLLSAYRWVAFRPTKAQRKHGARWFRCDVYVARSGTLAPLTRSMKPLLTSPTPTGVALCLAAGRPTTCDLPHSFKATSGFALSGPWPGATKVKQLARTGCDARVATTDFRWLAPTKKRWSYDRWVVCFRAHTLPPPPVPDTTAPTGTILSPETVPVGTPVSITGEVTDNVAVASLGVRVHNSAGYLQGDGTFAPDPVDLPITLTGGALATAYVGWRLDLDFPLPIDSYTITATYADPSGNPGDSSATMVVQPLPDTLLPEITLVSPGTDLGTSQGLDISGSVSDNVGVDTVGVQLRNSAGLYLQDDLVTYSAVVNYLPLTVLNLGTVSAQFDLDTGEQPPGRYTVRTVATDAAGNRRVNNRSILLTDTTNPQTVLYEMNEAPESTIMADTGGNYRDGVVNQLGVDTGVTYDGAIGYQWPYLSPNARILSPERVVTVPDNVLLDNVTDTFTIELRYRTPHNFGNIVQKGQSTTPGGQWKIQAPGGYPSCLFKTDVGQIAVQSVTKVSDGAWHTLRCIRTATSVRMYMDGVYQGIKNSPVPLGPINNVFPLTVGGKLDCDEVVVTCDYFTGQVDYLKLLHE